MSARCVDLSQLRWLSPGSPTGDRLLSLLNYCQTFSAQALSVQPRSALSVLVGATQTGQEATLNQSSEYGWTQSWLTKKEKQHQAPDRVRCVSPGQLKGAGDVSGFVGHIFVELGQGGGGGQVQGEPLVDRPGVGGVLNYAQCTRLLGCVVDLDNYWKE